MKTIKTSLETEAIFSEDGNKRYTLKKTWAKDKPSLTAILLAPSTASGIALDNTTMLVLNNADRLGYGSVTIVNLFATLDDFALKRAEQEDNDNLKAILQNAGQADIVVYAPGVGKANCKIFQRRQRQVLEALKPVEEKLRCLTSEDGHARFQHPLSPSVRTWFLSPFQITDLLPQTEEQPTKSSAKHKKTK